MKNLLAVLVVAHGLSVSAQTPQFPPVPFNDVDKKSFGLWANTGWVLDTEGEKRDDVQFVSEGAMPRIFVRREAQLSFALNSLHPDTGELDTLRRLDLALVGASAVSPNAIGVSQKDPVKHFYLPHCGTSGITNVPGYNRIVYPGIYPNIDLWVFSGQLGQKVMFVVWPGGDLSDIVLEFTGQNELLVDVQGWLRMQLDDKWISLPQLMAYQFDQNEVIEPLLWTAEYEPDDSSGIVTLEYDAYDPQKPLVLLAGPMAMGGQSYEEDGLCWSTYVGDDGQDRSNDVQVDAQGNIYTTGLTSSTLATFPANPGIEYALSGNTVAFLSRFTGDFQLSWAAFIGGNVLGSYSYSNALAIHEGTSQHILIAGTTNAQNFSTQPFGVAYYDGSSSNSLEKGFIAELTGGAAPMGGILTWSTYFGASNVNIEGIALHAGTGNVIVSGKALDILPNVQYGPPSGAMNLPYSGGWDAFIAILDNQRQLFVRSWFGGEELEFGSCARAGVLSFYIVGHINSEQIDMTDPGNGAYAQAYAGGGDCFILEVTPQGQVLWSTYLGGPGHEQPGRKGLYIGPERDIFVCGTAGIQGAGFPFNPGLNWYDDDSYTDWDNTGSDGFVARFDASTKDDLWITYLGGGNPHYCTSIVQDLNRTIWVGGYSTGAELPYTTLSGWFDQPTLSETWTGSFLARFSDEQVLEHATWFGGDLMTYRTEIMALAPFESGVFATGEVWKLNFAPIDSYWPLDDGGGSPWFDGEHNNGDISISAPDAFLSLFCSELSTPTGPLLQEYTSQARLAQDAGSLQVLGLKDGRHLYSLFDPAGHLLEQGVLQSQAGRSRSLTTDRYTSGVYILTIHGVGSFKFHRP